MECIVEDYLKYTTNFIYTYYRTLLDKAYDKKLIEPFVEKYIKVRYYNNTVFKSEENFLDKIDKELNSIAKNLIKENYDKEELIKNIYALFTYLLYLDDCYQYKNINTLLKTLFEDKNIKLVYTEEAKKEFKEKVNDFITQKTNFLESFNIKDFQIREIKIEKNIYTADLDYTFEVNKLYSDYAIQTAYNSEVVVENKLYLLILLLSKTILDSIRGLDFSKKYILEMPVTLLQKPKKQKRFLRALDNDILKNKINLCIKYRDYRENREMINQLINSGYSFALDLDDSYDEDLNCLVLFNNVFVYKKYNYYDNIMSNKDSINTNLIFV